MTPGSTTPRPNGLDSPAEGLDVYAGSSITPAADSLRSPADFEQVQPSVTRTLLSGRLTEFSKKQHPPSSASDHLATVHQRLERVQEVIPLSTRTINVLRIEKLKPFADPAALS